MSPSVDKIQSKDLPNHHRLAAYDIAILEALDLSQVPEGVYELIALPLVGGRDVRRYSRTTTSLT